MNNELEVDGPAASWVRLVGGPCDEHQVVLLDLVLAVVVTRDHPDQKWMIHEYFSGDRPELVANEVGYYRRIGGRTFEYVVDVLAVSHLDGHPHWSLAPVEPTVAAAT